jgi:hypothetical protein
MSRKRSGKDVEISIIVKSTELPIPPNLDSATRDEPPLVPARFLEKGKGVKTQDSVSQERIIAPVRLGATLIPKLGILWENFTVIFRAFVSATSSKSLTQLFLG